MSLSSSELGKRKNIIDNGDIDTNSSIITSLKKQKTSSVTIYRNYSFPSFICVDDLSNNYSLCISKDKNVYSIGYSLNKTHGHEETEIFPIKQIQGLKNIKMISCNDIYSFFLDYNGDVFSLGVNKLNTNNIKLLPPQKINIPPCKQVSCGDDFTLYLTEDNRLYSFSYATFGNNIRPQLIPYFNDIEYIVCGGYNCICKTFNNEFYSWVFYNYYGKLEQGNTNVDNKTIQCLNWPDNIIDIKCGYSHSLLLTSKGHVYSFGDNKFGQLGLNDKSIESINTPRLIDDIPEIQRIECGDFHSMCIDLNHNLWLFGHNIVAELGLGDTENRYKPIIHPSLSEIIDMSSGGLHTFVKTIDNKIYAFGNNNHSQLGIKTKDNHQLTPIQVFQDKEDIWCSNIGKSKQKSARK